MAASKPVVKLPLDKRPDFGRICGVASLYTAISGLLNGIAVYEFATPVGYTSGPCVNLGRFIASGDKNLRNILGICVMYTLGGVFAGAAGDACDGDAVFEGRTSYGMLFSAWLLVVGAYCRKVLKRPWVACQLWAFSQGIMNGTSSRCSAAPLRATHTAGGQTDAGIVVGTAWRHAREGKPQPAMRKVVLNALCTLGMIFGGFSAGKIHAKLGKKYGAWLALLPAALLAFSATSLPRLIALPEPERKD